jgi:peptide deformylase
MSTAEILHSNEVKQAVSDSHLALSRFRAMMGFGRAIAAPQVGHSLRLVALHWKGQPRTLFNPVITEASSQDTFTMWDDCLSFPDLMCCVRRKSSICVSFQDEQGERCQWDDCPQDLSELLQHEVDHLDGVLAVDIAVKPLSGESVVEGVVQRDEWLRRRDYYNSLVDFAYPC